MLSGGVAGSLIAFAFLLHLMHLLVSLAGMGGSNRFGHSGSHCHFTAMMNRCDTSWRWEIVVIAAIALGALLLRVWNLREVPFNIYPDEVMTGLALS
jgi:hypothetical protein